MSALSLADVYKSYGETEVIHGIDLEIDEGEFIVFVGPSCCGKSTLLRMIAGLESISAGELQIGGKRVNEMPPSQRGIAMVFQSYALYPHMTVYENMAFGMRIAKASSEEIERRVKSAADILQLNEYLDRLPKALSGGQRQRVAIGRAICRDPKVFLFDEPLSNLDAALRVATRIEIAKLKESMPQTTMIYVTHDQVEAMTLADRIVVLSAGYLEQVGAPIDLYERPANLFVAQFIGSPAMNIVPATLTKSGATTTVKLASGNEVKVAIPTDKSLEGTSVSLGFRPEDMAMVEGKAKPLVEGPLSLVESLGEVTNLYFDVEGNDEPLVAKIPGTHVFKRGEHVKLTADTTKMHLFGSDGRTLLK
ncbi:MAG: sn-glycerol-3-phosphate ABC transporter ATP-binding protein UgpC [Pseudomonadota bacterium]